VATAVDIARNDHRRSNAETKQLALLSTRALRQRLRPLQVRNDSAKKWEDYKRAGNRRIEGLMT
jgi:hypothetical protein